MSTSVSIPPAHLAAHSMDRADTESDPYGVGLVPAEPQRMGATW